MLLLLFTEILGNISLIAPANLAAYNLCLKIVIDQSPNPLHFQGQVGGMLDLLPSLKLMPQCAASHLAQSFWTIQSSTRNTCSLVLSNYSIPFS